MDTAQWPQEIVVVKPIEDDNIVAATNTCPKLAAASILEKKQPRPQRDQQQEQEPLNCPRCNSINTKFCYYNNYSLTQPRYFCKTCRRYWTAGGSLRNIPVGGSSRKNKRSSSIINVSCSSSSPPFTNNNNTMSASASYSTTITANTATATAINTSTASSTCQFSALELLTGITSCSRGLQHSFMPGGDHHNTVYNCGFPLQDFKPTLNFSLDGIGGISGFAGLHGVQENSGRVLFPFEDLKQVSSNINPTILMDQNNKEHHQEGYSTGYWTGMLGGGGGLW